MTDLDILGTEVDVVYSFFIFISGLLIAIKSPTLLRFYSARTAVALYFWHTLFCIVYCFYVVHNGGDAIMYYEKSISHDYDINIGTRFVIFFTSLFTNTVASSFLGVSLVYNIFGFIGLIAIYSSIEPYIISNSYIKKMLVKALIFLPSISYWTSGIGKDSLSFFIVGLLIWIFSNRKYNFFLIFFLLVFMFLIRPHIGVVLIVALFFHFSIVSKVKMHTRVFLFLIMILGSIVSFPLLLDFLKFDSVMSVDSVSNYIDKRQGYNLDSGSSIDISTMNPIFVLVSYMFRPFVWEARSFSQVVSAVDNLYLMCFFLANVYVLAKIKNIIINDMFYLCFFMICLLMLSLTTSNLGIAVRQKWIFMPFIIYIYVKYSDGKRR
ncbi:MULTISPECIES: hypothetical protein [Vibrio]|uniref:hypothetical protein n=1 Tax=Vibrio TaxID=662 RepID=UPI002963FC4B|nr:hypothetical protein [Vibrio sp. 947]MDW1925165.1 hypothetical protein [Vibrio sp. 947]